MSYDTLRFNCDKVTSLRGHIVCILFDSAARNIESFCSLVHRNIGRSGSGIKIHNLNGITWLIKSLMRMQAHKSL